MNSAETTTLAYLAAVLATKKKGFVALPPGRLQPELRSHLPSSARYPYGLLQLNLPGANVINLFTAVSYEFSK